MTFECSEWHWQFKSKLKIYDFSFFSWCLVFFVQWLQCSALFTFKLLTMIMNDYDYCRQMWPRTSTSTSPILSAWLVLSAVAIATYAAAIIGLEVSGNACSCLRYVPHQPGPLQRTALRGHRTLRSSSYSVFWMQMHVFRCGQSTASAFRQSSSPGNVVIQSQHVRSIWSSGVRSLFSWSGCIGTHWASNCAIQRLAMTKTSCSEY